jgi:poly-gamma-glutamate biosynthesis protein PgsC/CapC
MIITAFGLGIAIGFLFYELTGLTAGGIIVPGYIALYIEEPWNICATLIVAVIAYGIVLLISNLTIIYGRRRFLIFILTGFILKAFFERISGALLPLNLDLQVIGYIIPGLIANEFFRQGILKTLLSLAIVSLIVYLCLKIFFLSF